MGGDRVIIVERAVDWVAALVFGGSCAFAAWAIAPAAIAVSTAAAGFAGFAIALLALGRVKVPQADPRFAFEPARLDCPGPPQELVLTEAMKIEAAQSSVADAMLLDDALPDVDEQSRVVQLFGGPHAAGDLLGRIDRHLAAAPAAADDRDALYEALADLRHNLRGTA